MAQIYKNPVQQAQNLSEQSNDFLSKQLVEEYRGANKDLATKRRFHKNFFDLYGGDNEQAYKWLRNNYAQGLDDATAYLIEEGIDLDDINKWR